MSLTAAGKIAAGTAGLTGTGSLGFITAALERMAAGRTIPAGLWVLLGVLVAVTAGVAGLSLVLDYRQKKLETESAAELAKARQEMYRTVLEKSAGEPGSAASYRELIIADALHLAVERNDVRPADRTHGQLYRAMPGAPPADGTGNS
ncbi:MAG: hypothetical protein ACRDPY_30890 [Streptosporangiaceae bacterium]